MLTRQFSVTRQFIATLVGLVALLAWLPAGAQDNSEGRYRPDGRQIAYDISRMFGERVYEVRTYDPEPDVEEFADATIFYPLTLSFNPPIGAVALVPGFRGSAENYEWWGPMLASFGYAVMIIDTNAPDDNLEARKQALIAAVDFLRAENDAADSPIQGRIDTAKIAIMGHSLGGGASLRAAEELGDSINAVVPLMPYCCELGQSFEDDLGGQSVPTLIIASAADTIAPPAGHARALYESIAAETPAVYMEFAEGDHMMVTGDGTELTTQGRYAMAFLKYHLDGSADFGEAVYGEQDAEYEDKFSRYDSRR